MADATLRARQLDVEFTRVTAPTAGRVSARRVDPGNLIAGGTSAGDVLTTIVSADPIHFIFDASEAQLLKLQRQAGGVTSAPVQVRLQDEAEYRWEGTVDFLDNTVDPQSGSTRVRALMRNPKGFLKAGMYGAARMAGAGAYEALLIPETAIVADGPRKVAYVVAPDGAPQSRPLTLGPVIDGLRVIRAGLRPDDRVVVNGVQRVRPGQKVQARNVAISRQPAAAATRAAPNAAPASTGSIVRGGFHVETAASGSEAAALLKQPASPHLALVTDVNLGSGMTGWDVARGGARAGAGHLGRLHQRR